VDFVLRKFIDKWIEEGRFPREELRIRWWIALPGALVFLTLAIALIVVALG
jgi:hypothetical protein